VVGTKTQLQDFVVTVTTAAGRTRQLTSLAKDSELATRIPAGLKA
jgi:hypothetical protein